jgi:hypothetical protein
MSNTIDHYAIARDIADAVSDGKYEPEDVARALALAQVHATLSLRRSSDRRVWKLTDA